MRIYAARTLTLVAVVLAGLAALMRPAPSLALPPAGTDVVPVTAQIGIRSLLGSETIDFTGSATIVRGSPYLQGGVEVVDAELTAMTLTGASVTGAVSISESATRVSTGRIESLYPPPQQYPASAVFDVYVVIQAPGSPGGTVTLRNDAPLHLTTLYGSFNSWPPEGNALFSLPMPCLPLVPNLPAQACITSAIVGFPTNGGPVGGIAELPGEGDATALATTDSSRPGVAAIAAIAVGALVTLGAVVGGASAMRRRTAR